MTQEQEQKPRLKITEIFHSIQGESTLTGVRTTFVRLTGCPLRCTYCDTKYSYTGGSWMNMDEIVATVKGHGTKWVCITGGEPLAHKNTTLLVSALTDAGLKISIETDGEEDVQPYAGRARLIMDIKTPGSGENAEVCFRNLAFLTSSDEIKFVLCSRADYEWAKDVCREHHLTERFTVLFSPSHGQVGLKELAEWMIADKSNARLQTQLHKHIWGVETTGV